MKNDMYNYYYIIILVCNVGLVIILFYSFIHDDNHQIENISDIVTHSLWRQKIYYLPIRLTANWCILEVYLMKLMRKQEEQIL